MGCHGILTLREYKLTLNLPLDTEYVVAWNRCTVVAIIIRIYHVSFADLGDIRELLLLALFSAYRTRVDFIGSSTKS